MKIQNWEKRIRKSTGFTLIEMMIAVGIFTVIMVIGIGALLNISLSDQKTRGQRAVNDNINFIMEDIVRNIRTGSTYYCFASGESLEMENNNSNLSSTVADPKSCPNSSSTFAIGLERFNGKRPDTTTNHLEDQLIYNIRLPSSGPDSTNNAHGIIEKSTDGGQTFFDLSPNATPGGTGSDPNITTIYIDRTKSGFNVVGACPSASTDCIADKVQPFIVIRLAGTTVYKNTESAFNIETTVTQRLLDF